MNRKVYGANCSAVVRPRLATKAVAKKVYTGLAIFYEVVPFLRR